MTMTIASASRSLASSSRPLLRAPTPQRTLILAQPVRRASGRPEPSASDTRLDIIERVLFPPGRPRRDQLRYDKRHIPPSSPSGMHHPQVEERVRKVIGNAEAYETVERAWHLFQREKREKLKTAMEARFEAMREACEELDREEWRALYERAVSRPAAKVAPARGRKTTPETRWLDARIEGLVPREQWVPVERRGKPWDYDWKRPASS